MEESLIIAEIKNVSLIPGKDPEEDPGRVGRS